MGDKSNQLIVRLYLHAGSFTQTHGTYMSFTERRPTKLSFASTRAVDEGIQYSSSGTMERNGSLLLSLSLSLSLSFPSLLALSLSCCLLPFLSL